MASTPEGRRLTEAHRLAQQQVRDSFLAEFIALWALLDSSRLDETGPGWIRAVTRAVREFRLRSAEVATRYYWEFRAAEAPSPGSRPRIQLPPGVERDSRPETPPPPAGPNTGRPPRRRADGSRGGRPRRDMIPSPRQSEVRFDFDEDAFRQAGRRRTRVEIDIPDIDWEKRDRATEVSLIVTGPAGQKSKRARGKSEQLARDESFVEASGAAGRQVLTGGRQSLLTLLEDDPQVQRWARVTDSDPCAFCAMLAGRGAVFLTEESAGFRAHDHCVPPWTLVTGPTTEAAYRRWYEGELVIVGLTDGTDLSITPNHPVLTDCGWVDAGLLCEGDNVVRRAGADLAVLQVPHEHEVPAPIEDVWGAHRVNGLASVPVAAEDFHGDGRGTQGNVDVVGAHGQLSRVLGAMLGQQVAHSFMTGPWMSAVASALPPQRGVDQSLLGLRRPAKGSVRGGGVRGSLLDGQLCLMHQASLREAATLDARFSEPAPHRRAGNAVLLRQDVLWRSGEVSGDELGVRRFDPTVPGAFAARSRSDTAALQDEPQRLRIHTDLGRALLERLAGGVQLSRVRDLRRVHYSGHVLNLRTAEGWYDANGIIISNCACTAEPVYHSDAPWPGRAREFQQLWNDHIRGRYSGAEARRQWRRLYERLQREARREQIA